MVYRVVNKVIIWATPNSIYIASLSIDDVIHWRVVI